MYFVKTKRNVSYFTGEISKIFILQAQSFKIEKKYAFHLTTQSVKTRIHKLKKSVNCVRAPEKFVINADFTP